MPLFPSIADDALAKDICPMNPEQFHARCQAEEGSAGETAGGDGGDR